MRVTGNANGTFHSGDDPRNRTSTTIARGEVRDLPDDVARRGIELGYLTEGGDDPADAGDTSGLTYSFPVDDGTVQPQYIVTDAGDAGDLTAAIGQTVFPAPDVVGVAGMGTPTTSASSEAITGEAPAEPMPDPDAAPALRAAVDRTRAARAERGSSDAADAGRSTSVTNDPGSADAKSSRTSPRKASAARKR
jgi:hypothetical protein